MANQYTKKKLISQQNRKEIFWNIINALLAGSLVFLGSIADGKIEWEGIIGGLVAAVIVAITRFKLYWDKEKREYCKYIFNFIG